MIHITNGLKAVGIDIKKKVFKEIYDNLGGNIRIIVSAAAPIDKKVGNWLEDIGIMFLQGYGLTETAPISALTPDYKPKVGSAGKAVVQAEIKVNNPNENGEGEIMIKSPTLMLGYYEDEEATNEAIEIIDGERWFHSGDIGYIDKDGFIYLVDRKKDVIISGGENIYPTQVENYFRTLKFIKDVAVVGLPNKRMGEIVAAVIELKEEVFWMKNIYSYCKEIADYQRPMRLYFSPVIRNAMGKIDRKKYKKK